MGSGSNFVAFGGIIINTEGDDYFVPMDVKIRTQKSGKWEEYKH